MKRLSLWIPIFTILSLFFLNLVIFFDAWLPFYPLLKFQEGLDLLTPVVLIPTYWLLFRAAGRELPGLKEELVFQGLSAMWVAGQGIHLAANAINNLMGVQAEAGLIQLDGNDLYHLVYFLDEDLGHVVWHLGLLGLAGLLVWREWRDPAGQRTHGWSAGLSGVVYGFILFAVTVEGQTVWLGLPLAALLVVIGLAAGANRLREQPLLAFFLAACGFALLLYAAWGIYWGGFPEFGAVGLI